MLKIHGSKLQKIRQSKGLTQQQLSTLSGISKGYISKAENGKASNPGYDAVIRLAEALRVEPKEIVKRED